MTADFTVWSTPVTADLPAPVRMAFHAAAWSLCCCCAVLAKVTTAGGTAPSLPATAASMPAWYVPTARFSSDVASAAIFKSSFADAPVLVAPLVLEDLLLDPQAARTRPPTVSPAPARKRRRVAETAPS